MGFLRNPVSYSPMQFAMPQMPVAPEVNPIAAAQAAAQQQAQDALKQGSAGGAQPAAAGAQSNPGYVDPTAGVSAQGGGGMMQAINGLFGKGGVNPSQVLQFLGMM